MQSTYTRGTTYFELSNHNLGKRKYGWNNNRLRQKHFRFNKPGGKLMKTFILTLLMIISPIVFWGQSNCDFKKNENFNFLVNQLNMGRQFNSKDTFSYNIDTLTSLIEEIVYHTPDSIISLEEKLDILFLMVHFQPTLSNFYRHKLITKYLFEKDSLISKNPILLFPIAICQKCDTVFIHLILNNPSKDELKVLPDYYQSTFRVAYHKLEYSVNEGNIHGSQQMGTLYFLIGNITKNSVFQSKYPCFFQ